MSNKNFRSLQKHPVDVTTLHGTVVRALFIGNLPVKCTVDQMRSVFSKFGAIEKVSIKMIKSHEFAKSTFGFVTFEEAEDAARCLLTKSLTFQGRTIYINIADIWHQPDCNKVDKNSSINGTSQSSEGEASAGEEDEEEEPEEEVDVITSVQESPITKLNDDCLLYIFNFLIVNDRPLLSRVCRRWRNLMNNFWERFQELNYTDGVFSKFKLTEKNLQLHLNLCKNITSVNIALKGTDLTSNAIGLVAQKCDKLEELSIGYLNLIMRPLALVAHSCHHLKKMSITECNVTVGELGLLVSKCKCLEYLSIQSCVIKRSNWLEKLSPGLKTLALLDCDIEPHHLTKGLQNVSQSLTDLIIISKPKNILSRIFACLDLTIVPNLRTLCLKGSIAGDIACDPKILKNLNHLELELNHFVDDPFLKHLVECCPTLETLNLSGSLSDSLTEKGLLEVTSLTNLKHLNLSNICDVNDSVLFEVSKNLTNLTSLGLYLCTEITDSGCKRILTELPYLTELDVSLCGNFTEDSVIAAESAADKDPLKPSLTILAAKSGLKEDAVWNHPRVSVSLNLHSNLNWGGFWSSDNGFNKFDLIPPEILGFPFDDEFDDVPFEDDFDDFDDPYDDYNFLHHCDMGFDSDDSGDCIYFDDFNPFDNIYFIE